ncbi:MAG: hypothetical protein GC184_13725 [Rhizobiales bacterium]|nr:hypothetical protein [Hyphomicrobiales bacterium]
MKPLSTIELDTSTRLELLAILNAIELELWVGVEDPQERLINLTNQEMVRHILSRHQNRSR